MQTQLSTVWFWVLEIFASKGYPEEVCNLQDIGSWLFVNAFQRFADEKPQVKLLKRFQMSVLDAINHKKLARRVAFVKLLINCQTRAWSVEGQVDISGLRSWFKTYSDQRWLYGSLNGLQFKAFPRVWR